MRWVKALLGLGVVGGFVWFATQFNAGKIDVPLLPKHEPPAKLAAGTPVKLLLLTPLSSSGSQKGDKVRWLVGEPVRAGGGTVIAEGTVVEGEVVEAREGSVVGALTNRPARLAVKFGPLRAVDGTEIEIAGGDGAVLALTKANTRREPGHVLEAWEDPEARKYAEQLFGRMAKGEKLSSREQEEADRLLSKLTERYGLTKAKEAGGSAVLGKVLAGDAAGLSLGQLGLAVEALGELADLVGGADKAVRRMFTGSNIAATVGLEVTVSTQEDATVRPRRDEEKK